MSHAVGRRSVLVLRGCAVVAILGALVLCVPATARLTSHDAREWQWWEDVSPTVQLVGYLGLLCGLVGFAYVLVARKAPVARVFSTVGLSVLFAVLSELALGGIAQLTHPKMDEQMLRYLDEARYRGAVAASAEVYVTSPKAIMALVAAGIWGVLGGVLLLWLCRRMSARLSNVNGAGSGVKGNSL
ncbi:MAG: hypothetical protein J2P17_20010 [Mycobacterium sp.]|nr:hypothetical protein [Mycobacterium sp.]